ncbi:unnamed protein product, partial [Musa acuminata var. zebrina]
SSSALGRVTREEVAVNVLEKIKGNSWDLVNEVATISRIHHVNIIRHLGFYCDVNIIQLLCFCCDGTLRVLIYKKCWQQVTPQDFNNISLIGEVLFTKGQQHLLTGGEGWRRCSLELVQ